MNNLSFPSPTTFSYPKTRFGRIDDLRRQTRFNEKAFIEYVERTPFNLENQHTLVGLLQQLSIDPEWDLSYVVEYTRFRSYSLCTLFKITGVNGVGKTIRNGFYREGVLEQWTLIENDRSYDVSTLTQGNLTPVIPLYTTRTDHSYKHNLNRKAEPDSGDLALIGVNLVELAVGYWLFMQDPLTKGKGIHSYLATYPLVKAQLYHNQMAVFNVVYEHIVNGHALDDLITTDNVTFILTNEKSLLKSLCQFVIDDLLHNRLMDLGHLMAKLPHIYDGHYDNWIRAGKLGLYVQTKWFWDAPVMKLMELYLTIANYKGYKAGDVTSEIKLSHLGRINNYQRISDPTFYLHFMDLANRLRDLNDKNLMGKSVKN